VFAFNKKSPVFEPGFSLSQTSFLECVRDGEVEIQRVIIVDLCIIVAWHHIFADQVTTEIF
jgi:hypothetical protein